MSDLMFVAQAANSIDPSTVGISITSLLGSLGAAGAAVAVTYYFLVFLKDQSEKQSRLFQDFKDYHAESQKKFQDQLDRLSDRQEQSQRSFQDQVTAHNGGAKLVTTRCDPCNEGRREESRQHYGNGSWHRENGRDTPIGRRRD